MSSRIIRADAQKSSKVGAFKLASEIPAHSAIVSSHPRPEPEAVAAEELRTPSPNNLQSDPATQQSDALAQQTPLRLSELEREAYEKGFNEGQKTVTEIGEEMVQALLAQYSKSLQELKNLRKEVLAASEHEVVHLALEVARKIVKREIAVDEELILTLVKVALKRIADQRLITIRVHPKDYTIIQHYQSVPTDSESLSDGIKLVEDSLISRGGCVIETESGIIDARIEEQFREIERGFFN